MEDESRERFSTIPRADGGRGQEGVDAASWSSSEVSSTERKKKTVDQRMRHVHSIDELDFQYREDVQACPQCINLNGCRHNIGFHRDKKMYRHVVKFRKILRKDRITVDDLSDDIASMQVKKRSEKDRIQMLEQLSPDKLKREQQQQQLQEDRE